MTLRVTPPVVGAGHRSSEVYDSTLVVASAPESLVLRSVAETQTRASVLVEVATGVALVLGVGLRVWRPDLAQTNFDESNVASLVAAWKNAGLFPLTGTVSSYGFRAAEGWPWFAALGLLWTDDPYALIGVGIAAGIGGLLACWWVARRWLGPWGGVAAALCNGTMFYAVVLARGAWQPAFLQAPMALCLDALLLLGARRRPWALVAACAWLGVLVSVHYTAVVFALLLPFAAWPARRVLRPRHVVAALLAGVLPLMPFVLFEVNPGVRFEDFSQVLALSGARSSIDLDTITSTIQVSSTYGAAGLGGHAAEQFAAELGRWTTLSLLGPLLAALGLAIGVVRRPRGVVGWLIAGWALMPILAYLRHSAPVIFHYMFIEFPGLAMGVGVLGAWAAASRSRLIRAGVGLAIVTCAVASALSVLVLLGALDRLDMSAGYGIPVGSSRAAGLAARNALPPGGTVLIGDDPHSGEVLRYAVGYATPSRTFEDCREVPYAPDAVYLLASERTPGAEALAAAGAPLLARIERPGGDAFRVYGPPPGANVQVLSQPDNLICQDRLVWDL